MAATLGDDAAAKLQLLACCQSMRDQTRSFRQRRGTRERVSDHPGDLVEGEPQHSRKFGLDICDLALDVAEFVSLEEHGSLRSPDVEWSCGSVGERLSGEGDAFLPKGNSPGHEAVRAT